MAAFLLILICVGLLVGTGAYIALMNSIWWKSQQNSPDMKDQHPPG